jgi:hypothetical protein
MIAFATQGSFMAADSDSNIAWHRAQLRKHREALRNHQTTRFTIGEIAGSKQAGQMQKALAELTRKIRQSEQAIAAYDRQTQRPRATDFQSLANVRWEAWNARSTQTRGTGER